MCDLKVWKDKKKMTALILPGKELSEMQSYAREIRQEGREEGKKAAEAENRAVQHYVDRVRLRGMQDSAIIEEIEEIWGWSPEKARTAVLGAAT